MSAETRQLKIPCYVISREITTKRYLSEKDDTIYWTKDINNAIKFVDNSDAQRMRALIISIVGYDEEYISATAAMITKTKKDH